MNTPHWMSHGQCWFWDWRLILIHGISDLLIFIAYMLIPITALYIYKNGHLDTLKASYPGLWLAGMAFVGFCGLSHLGSFIEIWYGDSIYWITGINKVLMSIASIWFAVSLWKVKDEIITISRILQAVNNNNK